MAYILMKTASWFLSKPQFRAGKARAFIISPYLSLRSLSTFSQRNNVPLRFFLFSALLAIAITLAGEYLAPLSQIKALILSPVIYFLTEAIGGFGQLLFYQTPTFPIHRSPLKATSLGHFWGKDWNIWVKDWLRDISGAFKPKHRVKKIIVVFLVSGLFHEIMCNLPYWIYYKKSYFGTMLSYFLIQGLGLWMDKKFVIHWHPVLRRVYLWSVVILPSPLFINVPLLTFFGLSHE